LRESDELIACLGPVPTFRNRVLRPYLLRQERAEQAHPELTGRNAFVALLVFVHNGVDTRRPGAASLAERDFLTGNILQLNGHMLEDVPEPRSLVFPHPPEKPSGHAVRTAVLCESGKC